MTIGYFFLMAYSVSAQDQRVADSLATIYHKNAIKDKEKLELLRNLTFNEVSDLNKSLRYAEELIDLSKVLGNEEYLFHGYFQKGNKKRIAGNLEDALNNYFQAAEIAKKLKRLDLEGSVYSTIADVYSMSDNHKISMFYYHKAITTLKKTDVRISLASAFLNAGDALLTKKEYDSALVYFKESSKIFEKENYSIGKAYNLGNIGIAYANLGKNQLAEVNIREAVSILEVSEDYYAISVYLLSMADIYIEKGDYNSALSYAQQSLALGKKHGLKEQISDANLKLSQFHETKGNSTQSLLYFKDHIIYRDSVTNIESVQKIADLRTNFEVSQKQTEIDLLDQRRKNQRIVTYAIGIALFFIALLAFLWYRRYLFIRKTKQIIETERDRSDQLLLNILPEDTATELKLNGKVQAKKHESVTVLFSDFQGFTSYSENLSPEELVETVDFYFSKFDTIMEAHGLEKIKTIGDAYMCAGGLHGNTTDAAHQMILAAKEIIDFVETTKNNALAHELTFDIRIGINSGPVVAGVVGSKKFAYDIWGDTVNVASRMESMSLPGKINISERTYELIKDRWTCEYRGEIQVKNRGHLTMYFVN